MMELKISLNFLVPSATMLSSQECEKNPQKNYDTHKVHLEYIKGKGKNQKKVKETITVKTRKSRLISHNLNMSKDAYDWMIANPPTAKLMKIWSNISKYERLRHHFDLIANDLNAKSYTFEILDD